MTPCEENGSVRRTYTSFSRLITTVVDLQNGRVRDRTKTHRLDHTEDIVFEVRDGNTTGTFTFSIAEDTGGDPDLVVTPSADFEFTLQGREWKPKNNAEPRITKIRQGNRTLLNESAGDLKRRVVLATLLASPEGLFKAGTDQQGAPDANTLPPRPGQRGASMVRTTILTSLLVVIGLLGFRFFEGSRGSHDDPIVVDNGPITIVKGNAAPVKKDTPKRWMIHHSDQLRLLYAFTQAADGETWRSLEQPIPLSGVKNITFDLVEPGQPKVTDVTIYRDRWYEALVPKAHLDARIDFVAQGKALTPQDQKYRIGQVWVEGQPVCLVDTDRPVTTKCANWRQKPFRVKVLICAKADKCDSLFPPTS